MGRLSWLASLRLVRVVLSAPWLSPRSWAPVSRALLT